MAYDEDLANRIRELIAAEPDVSEESMFEGLVFLVGGNISVAAGGQGDLIVRVRTKHQLERWGRRAVAYAHSLPSER